MEIKNIETKLSCIQNELKVPKGQKNTFGNYKYRSCEDILEAAKPICFKNQTVLVLSDTLENIGDRYYIKATATLYDLEGTDLVENTAYAREEEVLKGMSSAQITGTASSYARKYALNGLFSIDDTKDADTDEYTKQTNEKEVMATEEQITLIKDLVEDTNSMLDYYKLDKMEDLTLKQASEIIKKKTK